MRYLRRMGRFEKVALAIAALATMVGAVGISGDAYRYYLDQVPSGKIPVGAAGWVIATYGPIAVAVLCWRHGKRASAPLSWVLHLVFLLCAWGLFIVGDSMMLSVIQDPDFDAMMGGPELVPNLLLFVVVGSYFAALIVRHVSRIRNHVNH